MIKIKSSIFRDYDIRGIYPGEVNEDTFLIIGRALADFFKADTIAVGRDTRLSSPSLQRALIEGITSQGVNIVDLGLISTEINYFSSGFNKFPANVIVSASHNPPNYNGLKIVKKGVIPLSGSYGLPEVKELALNQQFKLADVKGKIASMNILDDWIKHVLSFINPQKLKPMKVVIDAANGMGGISWQELIKHLPIKIIPLYFEPDGNFPNHLADPLEPRNLEDLQKAIRVNSADFGFAIDGDADRLFIVDDKSNLVSGSVTTALLSEHLLEKHGPAKILFSVTCGKIVAETILKHGGIPIKTRVGHSFIKNEMRVRNGLFAGEHSGHFYFRDNFTADSSTIAGLLFLEFMSLKSEPLSAVRSEYDKYPSSGEINFYVDDSQKIIDNLISILDPSKTDNLDGVTFEFDKWWFNIRLSKTEPLLRLNIEADNQKLLTEKYNIIEAEILAQGGKKKH